jgi:hypothetical protein
MNKIFCNIYELIKAHFEGNEDNFKSNLKAVANYCEKEGNIKGADELREYLDAVVKQDNRTVRKYFKENPDGTQTEITKEEFDRLVGLKPLKTVTEPASIKPIEPVKQFVESIEPDKESIEPIEPDIKADKAEMKENTVNKEKSEDEPKKRHRRTKAEMEEYRNSDEYKQEQERPKRHRRTKAEMLALRGEER